MSRGDFAPTPIPLASIITQHVANGTTSNYTYGDAAHKHAVTAVGSSTYGYDANGNMNNRASATLVYDQENRLSQMTETNGTVTNYTYDGKNNRVKRVVTSPGPTPAPVTFNPTADAYVDASDPTTNFGTLTQLRTDGDLKGKGFDLKHAFAYL